MSSWRTRIDTPLSRLLGVSAHAAIFEALDDTGGARTCVALQVPEASRREIKAALAMAAERHARLVIVCDTAEQAADMAELAARRLRRHRRVPYERAAAGAFGPLS